MSFQPRKRKRVQLLEPVFTDPAAQKNYDEVRTRQEFKDDCDINFIVRRNIQFPPAGQDWVTADLTEGPFTYEEFINDFVPAAHAAFMALPQSARDELQNDPRNLLSAEKAFFERHGLMAQKESPTEAATLSDAIRRNTEALKNVFKKPKADASQDDAGDS